jgi:PKD repeat protein
MKNRLTTLFVAIVACTIMIATSCTKPSASFTASTTTAAVGAPIVFTNTSSDDRQAMWDFGDGTGSTSTEKTISHIYQLPGTYNVSLTATTKSGKKPSDATSMMITITGAPVANFTMSDSIPAAYGVVTFTSTSSNAEEYVWDFGDGNVPVTPGPVESHSYSMSGVYSVTLTVFAYNHTLSSTKTKLVVVGGDIGNNIKLALIIGRWKLHSRVVTDYRNGSVFTSDNAGFAINEYQLNSEGSTTNYKPRQIHEFTSSVANNNIIISDSLGNSLGNGTFSLLDSTRMSYVGFQNESYTEPYTGSSFLLPAYATYVVTANSLIITYVSNNPSLPAYTDYTVSPPTGQAHVAGEVQKIVTVYTYAKQ